MRKVVALVVAAVAISAPAIAACTEKQGPKSPVVCIHKITEYDPVTKTSKTVFVPSPNPVRVGSGEKVKFKFESGTHKLSITTVKQVLHGKNSNGPEWSAFGDDVQTDTESKYTIRDENTGVETDPTIIIEPLDGTAQAPAPEPRPKYRKD